MKVDTPLVFWIVDYLAGEPQYARLQDGVSDTVVSIMGAPQWTVTLSVHPLHLQIQVLPPAEVFRQLCNCGLHQ